MTTSLRSACAATFSRSRIVAWSAAAACAAQFGSLAHAQSTGSAAMEDTLTEVIVEGKRIAVLGSVSEQTATKTRVAVSQEYLQKQVAGQSIMQSLNQVPGVNFTNNDAYGSSGGNIRIRGFDNAHISGTFDGMPVNDSGNYALYTNQIIDPELIESLDVNLGTTDVDSPTASATGGTVAFRSLTPQREMGGEFIVSVGDDSYRRAFGRFETGEFGPWATKAWIAASALEYDKFKGPGDMEKQQYNFKIQQDFGDSGDFVTLAGHWNRNRMAFYRNTSIANYKKYGRDYDNLPSCTRDAPTPGVADNDNATIVPDSPTLLATDNVANPSSCTNYWGVRINPSNTGNIRAQSLWHLGEKFRLTVDPSFQYTLANGGGSSVQNETVLATDSDKRLIGNTPGLAGFDINGDGDILDSVRLYSPSITNTRRYGLNSSLIYEINDSNTVRVAYSLDYAEHTQTAQWGYLNANGDPLSVFAGRDSRKVRTADGNYLRGRDRYSIAELNQYSAEYRGKFLEDKLNLNVGLRTPYFTRELNQHCYTQNGGNGGALPGSLCTTQTPVATRANGNVVFTNAATATEYIAPYHETIKFDDVLPNAGATYKLTDTMQVYVSYAENLSAPRTDNLYPVRRQPDGSIGRGIPESETTKAYDIGWRVNSADFLASAAIYKVDYDNRIVSAFDSDLGFSVDRNLGTVEVMGVDLQAGWRPIDMLTLSGSTSYNDSEVKQDSILPSGAISPTKGKQLVETPEWTFAARADLALGEHFTAGLQGKYVDKRPGTDTNDEFAPSYTVWDLDAAYTFEVGAFKKLEAQLNVTNLFDEEYFGSISSGTGGGSVGFYYIGAPRTVLLSLKAGF